MHNPYLALLIALDQHARYAKTARHVARLTFDLHLETLARTVAGYDQMKADQRAVRRSRRWLVVAVAVNVAAGAWSLADLIW